MVEASSKSNPAVILMYLSSMHLLCDGSNATQPKSFIYISTHAWVVFSPEFVSSSKKPFTYLAGRLLSLATLISIWAKSWQTPLPNFNASFELVDVLVEPPTYSIAFETIRLIHLHLSIPLVIIFYKCLYLKFKNIEKSYLILLSLVIFLSPTFRSLSIWPDSRLPGLLFFTITIYFFLP